jgi:RND family efflux transporter, MFP subunit
VKNLIAIALTGILLAGLSFLAAPTSVNSSIPKYRLATVDQGPIVAVVNATGTINPITTVIVGSQLSGQVVEILANYNDEVKAGQILARLNSDQIRYKLDAAKADIAQMNATKAMQEVEVAQAQRNYQRQNALRPTAATSEATYEAARSKLESAESQLEVIAAQILQREAALKQIEVDLRNTDIRSPVDGVVIKRDVELGQTVAATYQAPTLFTLADDLRRMEIAANIDETDVGRIRPDQRVTFGVTAYPGREFEGRVRQIRLGSTTVSNVVIYTAIISIENPKLDLFPGMTANLRIETAARDKAYRVPNAALRWAPSGKKANGQSVYVLENGTPKAVPVKTGVTDGVVTEIMSNVQESVIVGVDRAR